MRSRFVCIVLGDQRGLAAVEAVFVLPILVFLMMATAEVGRLIYTYNTLTKAVESGARYLSRYAGAAPAKVQNIVVYGNDSPGGGARPLVPGLTLSNVTVQNYTTDTRFVEVNIVNFRYSPMFASTLSFFGTGSGLNLAIPLNAGVVMRANL